VDRSRARTALRVFILQPVRDDGPCFLATFLREQGIAFQTACAEDGDAIPRSAAAYDAVAMLGGPMSVNDALPFLRDAAVLLRDAVDRDVPVLGHCLGGQMLARVLGAAVTDNPQPEIGWTRIVRHDHPLARAWLGDAPELAVYQWHSQTFALPERATRLASNDVCANQVFAIGPHLGMQFHIEVDAAKLGRWCSEAPQSAAPRTPGVQTEGAMRLDTQRWLASSQRTAARIYARWLALARQADPSRGD
jgi:GMP synthase (glutamine-hydrolysing)